MEKENFVGMEPFITPMVKYVILGDGKGTYLMDLVYIITK
jgi:hypothetical protein